jgi:hypothetical protein
MRDPVDVLTDAGPPPAPTFAQHGSEFEYCAADREHRRLVVTLARVHEKDDTISAEVCVTRDGRELEFRRLNLLTDGRQRLIKTLDEIAPDVAWRDVIDPACRQTVAAIRAGRPAVLLKRRAGPVLTWFLQPFLPQSETTILFGPPDNLKSYVAGLSALLIANGRSAGGLKASSRVPVMVLDNETTEATWSGRLTRLAEGLRLELDGIYYRELTRSLPQEIDAIAAEVSRLGIGFVILDSQAPAAGEKPESADASMRTLPPLRSLGPKVTRLVLAHMSKASSDDRESASVYGSIFNAAQARATWEARRSTDDDGDEVVISLTNRKLNDGRRQKPIALRFRFDGETGPITVSQAEIGDRPDLLARAPIRQQIRAVLALGHKTVPNIIAALGDAKPDTIKRTISRMREDGELVPVGGDTEPVSLGLVKR